MRRYLLQLQVDGGEGMIIRKWFSLYQHGRSKELFKYKVWFGVFTS